MKKLNINITTIIIIGVLFLIGFFGYKYYSKQLSERNNRIDYEVKLKNALQDTIKIKVNKYNEIVGEKLTLQGKVSDLNNANNKLSNSQKELLNRVQDIEKENKIINAALVETKVKLDSLRNASIVLVDSSKNTINFSDSLKDIKYNILVGNVKTIKEIKPFLSFQGLELKNKQFIEFHWGDKKNNYPVSFTISNSNKYFQINNIESYAIPELNKNKIKPTGWQKFVDWTTKTSGKLTIFGIGVGIGIVIIKAL